MAYGRSGYGRTLYAGESDEAPPGPTPTPLPSPYSLRRGGFGCGTWTAYITSRGGSPVLLDVDFSDGSVSKAVNQAGSGQLNLPNVATTGSSCCEVFAVTDPWKDELVIYRDNDLAFVGPVQSLSVSPAGGSIQAADLFSWFDVRILEDDFHGEGDAADVFEKLFDLALALEPSINMSLSVRRTGVHAVRDFLGSEFVRAADVMRELGRSALDYTMHGRRLLAGGQEVFQTTTPLILHDEGVVSAEVSKEGGSFATDVMVFGTSDTVSAIPFSGRATRSEELYGLVQRSFSELTIKDGDSAYANAEARLSSMQPTPIRLKVTLGPEAPFEFNDLIAGRRVECYLQESAGCVPVFGTMRLQQVDIQFGPGTESVTLDLIPLGVSEDA